MFWKSCWKVLSCSFFFVIGDKSVKFDVFESISIYFFSLWFSRRYRVDLERFSNSPLPGTSRVLYCRKQKRERRIGDEVAFDVLNSGINKCHISIARFACLWNLDANVAENVMMEGFILWSSIFMKYTCKRCEIFNDEGMYLVNPAPETSPLCHLLVTLQSRTNIASICIACLWY